MASETTQSRATEPRVIQQIRQRVVEGTTMARSTGYADPIYLPDVLSAFDATTPTPPREPEREALVAAHVAGQRVHDLRVDTIAAEAYAASVIPVSPNDALYIDVLRCIPADWKPGYGREWGKLGPILAEFIDDLREGRYPVIAPASAQPVANDALRTALERVRADMESALNKAHVSAVPVCCGRPGEQCCGSPEPEWDAASTAIMDTLGPIHRQVTDALGATPAAAPETAACAKCAATDAVIDGYVHAVKQAQAIEAEADGVDDEDRTQVYAIVGYWHDKLLALRAAHAPAPGEVQA